MKSSIVNCRQKKPAGNSRLAIYIAAIACFLISNVTYSQTLFTYGKHAVSKDEFLRAYSKNNSDTSGHHISYNDYLELYSRFKLKVQAARDAGMDTSSEQKAEVESFRLQLADNFLKDDASTKLLVDEAFERSKKDIDVSYIFSPVCSPDSIEIRTAKTKIEEAYHKLEQGEKWETVSSSYEHGDAGFITVFVLPYAIENAAYNTPQGTFSKPFRSGRGFYIIRNNRERNAVGKIRVAQILLAYHPTMNEQHRLHLQRRADSLYNNLLEGGNFADSAKKYSNDNLTYQNGGEMPAFGLGEYDTAFTNAAFALQKDGEISSPVKTSYGFHILMRLQKIDVISDSSNAANMEMLKEKVLQSDRMQFAQATLIKKIKKTISKDTTPGELESDSAVLDYYRRNLEKYNQEYAEQLAEFKEGNLLFGIMQKKVWDAAASDSAGLRDYYEHHRNKYNWEASADAIIITSADPHAVDSIQQLLKKNVAGWRDIAGQSNGLLQADSGRFELAQIPVIGRTNFTGGIFTAPVTNEQDSSKTFAYIIKTYMNSEPKKFEDAKGAVINDYQVYLEEQWIAGLKKKYPVKVNRRVFSSLPRNLN